MGQKEKEQEAQKEKEEQKLKEQEAQKEKEKEAQKVKEQEAQKEKEEQAQKEKEAQKLKEQEAQKEKEAQKNTGCCKEDLLVTCDGTNTGLKKEGSTEAEKENACADYPSYTAQKGIFGCYK